MAAGEVQGSAHIHKLDAAVVQRLCLLEIDRGGASHVVIAAALVHQRAILLEGYIGSSALRNTSLAQALHQPVAVCRIVVEHVAVPPPASRILDGNAVGCRRYAHLIVYL